MAAVVDKNECIGCEQCVDSCPVEAISMDGDKATINADSCVDCGQCIDTCPSSAISL